MAVKIGHSSIDENGKIHGGTAGDQSLKEICTRNWYAGGWTVLLRPKSAAVAEKMAKACEAGCANNKIGYDQYQRNTLRTRAKAAGWDLSKITTACECDCSSFMAVCAEAAGVNMDSAYTSGNAPATFTMRAKFKATGAFDVLTAGKYLNGSDYLKRGDILVKESAHTVMVLSNGAKVAATSTSTGSSSGTSSGTGKALAFKVGDVVEFTGSKHYANAGAANGTSCKAGKAKVTGIYPAGKHPYHLVAEKGSPATVYGWVDAADVKAFEISVGDVVQFAGGPHYASANAAKSSDSPKAGPAKVTAYVKGAKHPYHVIHTNSASTVYGWVDADKLTK